MDKSKVRFGKPLLLGLFTVLSVIADGAALPTRSPLRTAYDYAKIIATPKWEPSFEILPRQLGGSNFQVYIFAGTLETSFDSSNQRPDSVIMPTNAMLRLDASFPTVQNRVLYVRLRTSPSDMARVQTAMSSCISGGPALRMEKATDICGVELWANDQVSSGSTLKVPKFACFVATDDVPGGSGNITQRDFYTQSRLAVGVQKCLVWLDNKGAKSVEMPLIGSASGWTGDPQLKNVSQYELLQCRLLNSIAGIAQGISNAARVGTGFSHLNEIGIVQWIDDLEKQRNLIPAEHWDVAYNNYASQVQKALHRGLEGISSDAADLGVDQNCNLLFGFSLDAPISPTPH